MIARAGWVVAACLAVCLVGLAAPSHAQPAPAGDAVALLPLDTDRSLEIYSQPVARAIARALEDGKIQVVVVGAKMAMPERARLIVDGTLRQGKGGAVAIALRIRSTADGKVLETLSATAPALARLDVTAAELSARVLPIVRDKLAALHARPARPAPPDDRRAPPPSARAAEPDLLIGLAVADEARSASSAALLGALDTAATAWAREHHRQPRKLDPARFDAMVAAPVVATAGIELGVGFWILGYTTERTALPMARARVRVRVADARTVLFDRVVVTDTVLGDKGSSPPELAARVAREVLAILGPHLQRRIPSWR
jgi:hypothetical protein